MQDDGPGSGTVSGKVGRTALRVSFHIYFNHQA